MFVSYTGMTGLKHCFREAPHVVTMRSNMTVKQKGYFRIGIQILYILEIGIDMLESWHQISFRNDRYMRYGKGFH